MSAQTRYAPWRYERPPFGEFGNIATVGERLVCHVCGRDYINLERHVGQTHGITAREYKVAFGLNMTTPLWAESLRRTQSQKQTARGLGDLGRAATARATPEWLRARNSKAGHAVRGEPERRRLAALARSNARKGNDAARAAGVLDWRARLTHCKRGHEFTPQNTRPTNAGRQCRTCNRDRMRVRRASHLDNRVSSA